jgi:hypothetical protein
MKFVEDMARVKSGDNKPKRTSQDLRKQPPKQAQFVVSKSGILEGAGRATESVANDPDYYVYEYERARIEREQKLRAFLTNKQREHIRKMAEKRDREEVRRKIVISHQSLWDPKNLAHMGLKTTEHAEDLSQLQGKKKYLVVGTEIARDHDNQVLQFDGKSCDQYYRDRHHQEYVKSRQLKDMNTQESFHPDRTTANQALSVRPEKQAAAFRIQKPIFVDNQRGRRQDRTMNLSVSPSSHFTIAEPTVVKYNKMNEGSEVVHDKYRYFDQDKRGVQFIIPVQQTQPNKSPVLDKSATTKQLPKLTTSLSMKQYTKLPKKEEFASSLKSAQDAKTLNLAAKGVKVTS